jgi:hypothetical protein
MGRDGDERADNVQFHLTRLHGLQSTADRRSELADADDALMASSPR